jgi:hypothetical protein
MAENPSSPEGATGHKTRPERDLNGLSHHWEWGNGCRLFDSQGCTLQGCKKETTPQSIKSLYLSEEPKPGTGGRLARYSGQTLLSQT